MGQFPSPQLLSGVHLQQLQTSQLQVPSGFFGHLQQLQVGLLGMIIIKTIFLIKFKFNYWELKSKERHRRPETDIPHPEENGRHPPIRGAAGG